MQQYLLYMHMLQSSFVGAYAPTVGATTLYVGSRYMYLQKALLYPGCKLLTSSLHTLCDSLWQPFLDEANVLISFVAFISLGIGTEKGQPVMLSYPNNVKHQQTLSCKYSIVVWQLHLIQI